MKNAKQAWGYRYVILFVIWILYIINYFDRMAVLTFLPYIQKDMGFTPTQTGLVASSFFFAYAIGQITSGFLSDKFGSRKVMSIAIGVFTVVSVATGLVRTFGQFIAVRIGLGLGEAHHFPPSAKAISNWFPRSKRATAISLFNTSNYIGMSIVPIVLTTISAWFFDGQWRPVFYMLAIPGIIGILLLAFCFTNTPDEMYVKGRLTKAELDYIKSEDHEILPGQDHQKPQAKIYLQDPTFYIVCIIMICQMGMLWGLTTWLSSFLVQQHNFNIKTMGLLASFPPIISIISILIGGWLFDKLNRMKPIALFAYIGCIPILWAIGSVPTGDTTRLVILLLLSGFFVAFNSGSPTAILQKRYPSEVVGGATGLVNGVGQMGAFLAPLIASYLVVAKGGGSFDYSNVFIFFSFLAVIASISALFLNEKPFVPKNAESSDSCLSKT